MPIKSHTTPANIENAAENPKPIIEKPEVRFPLPKLLDGLTDDEEQSLQTFLVILRRFDGCTTPVEEFICNIVHNYGYRPIKPDDIEWDLKTLLADWDDAVEVARLFAQEHPELLADNVEKASSI